MPIITPRLMIRPPQAGDGKALVEAKRESWEDLKPWLPFAHGDVSNAHEEIDEKMCRTRTTEFVTREDLMLFAFAKESGKFIASSGLHRINWKLRRFEIGYWVRSSETKKGYAQEITNALTRYAFNALAASKVTVGHHGGNDASRHVIEKLGFIKEGHLKAHDVVNGRILDSLDYARFDLDGLPALDISWGAGS